MVRAPEFQPGYESSPTEDKGLLYYCLASDCHRHAVAVLNPVGQSEDKNEQLAATHQRASPNKVARVGGNDTAMW